MLRLRWTNSKRFVRLSNYVKNPVQEEDSFSEEEVVVVKEKKVKFTAAKQQSENEDDDDFVVVGKGGKTAMPVVELNAEAIFKKLNEIIVQRGKRGTDKAAVIEGLKALLDCAKSPYQKSRVLLSLIPAQFDISTSAGSGHMPTEAWHRYYFLMKSYHTLVWPRTSVLLCNWLRIMRTSRSNTELRTQMISFLKISVQRKAKRLNCLEILDRL